MVISVFLRCSRCRFPSFKLADTHLHSNFELAAFASTVLTGSFPAIPREDYSKQTQQTHSLAAAAPAWDIVVTKARAAQYTSDSSWAGTPLARARRLSNAAAVLLARVDKEETWPLPQDLKCGRI